MRAINTSSTDINVESDIEKAALVTNFPNVIQDDLKIINKIEDIKIRAGESLGTWEPG